MAAPYLLKRRASWYLRLRVPADLRPVLGIHLTRTLGTRDYDAARRRAVAAAARAQAFWAEARGIVVEEWMSVWLWDKAKWRALSFPIALAFDASALVAAMKLLSGGAH